MIMGLGSSHDFSGSKNDTPLPISQRANYQTNALFTSERSSMDYVTLSGVCKRTRATEDQLTVFLLKEIIDNAIDFIEVEANTPLSSTLSNYASDDAQLAIYVDIKYDQDKTAAIASNSVEL